MKRTLYRLAAVSVATLMGAIVGAQSASAAAYTVWAPFDAATTTYHTGVNRIVVCDRLADGLAAYGELAYWDGSRYVRVGYDRDRDGANNGSCAEFVAGFNVPDRRWIRIESCTVDLVDGEWLKRACSWRDDIWDDGTS